MASAVHEAPPSRLATMAAPLGAPFAPAVRPVAQHRVTVGQLTSVSELTGAGRSTEAKTPVHGVPTATVPVAEAASRAAPDVHPAARRARATMTAAAPDGHGFLRWIAHPHRLVAPPGRLRSPSSGQRTLTTKVWAALSWNPCRRLSHKGDRPATME